jgi:hypothetical protein
MDDADIGVGIKTSVFKACAISADGSGAVATNTSQVGIDEQAADECGVFVCDTGFFKASSREVEKPFFVY